MSSLDARLAGPLRRVHDDIRSMKTRGAGAIGKEAALALARVADDYDGATVTELRSLLLEAAKLLADARPTAVTLRNGLNRMLDEASRGDAVDDTRKRLRTAADAYARAYDEARHDIPRQAVSHFRPNDVILTHCHSTAAGAAIAYAASHLPGIRVFSTETRPFRQGLIQAPALAKQGVDVTLIVDSAVAHVMENEGVTRVVVGADTVAADGSLYNKIGTRQVALLAHEFDVPFLVCAERDKFSPYTLDKKYKVPIEERPTSEIASEAEVPGVKIFNPVFDRTPADHVKYFVTEKASIEPHDVRAFVKSEFENIPLRI